MKISSVSHAGMFPMAVAQDISDFGPYLMVTSSSPAVG